MSAKHPMIGVAFDQKGGQAAAFPVCDSCWRDPAHRLVVLKMHFFPADRAREAVAAAGASKIG